MNGERIRVTGTVQGVGFRPTVWRLANECGLVGDVCNDAKGVLIHAWGSADSLHDFARRLQTEPPPLANIERVVRTPLDGEPATADGFEIVVSGAGAVLADVAADAATCPECLGEVLDPANRRFRYPFTNCTHCGPRLSIVRAIPYDRANTSMASFPMCAACQREYDQPADRRFHAQPNACAECGPSVWLEDMKGQRVEQDGEDAIDVAAGLLRAGHIVAIKGLGGFHLGCDAANASAVGRLRDRKHRYQKALALMATDVPMVRRFAHVSAKEATLLAHRGAPIVVLEATGEPLPGNIAPGQSTLGFMLPYTPLHHLLMQGMQAPIVLTSGNLSDEPQAIDNDDARDRLATIADYCLLHDRDIVNRLDDSVMRVAAAEPRFLRRARGYAPAPLRLADGFANAPRILAMGGDLKNTFCLLRDGKAIVSQHIGDMEDTRTLRDHERNLGLYCRLFDHHSACVALDKHPEYSSTKRGLELAARAKLPVVDVQHHHAHIAACLAEHGAPPDTPPVLGVALDGLGYGDDGTFWGGEFLLADYLTCERLACFQPVVMPGGTKAVLQPWRNTWAHLHAAIGWSRVRERYADLDVVVDLESRPIDVLQTMAERNLNSPLSSSCGRLFDAVAGAVGVCRDELAHEAQAAMELESLAAEHHADAAPYPLQFVPGAPATVRWQAMWAALLDDLRHGASPGRISARFHRTVSAAVTTVASQLCQSYGVGTVVLSGGVLQNRLILEDSTHGLTAHGLTVLSPAALPANDGGLSLGQATIAAARLLRSN